MIVVPPVSDHINNEDAFISLLKTLDVSLNDSLSQAPDHFENLSPLGFEKLIFDSVSKSAEGTVFQDNVKHISGQRFPDIIARIIGNGGFGLEVKATTQNKWITTGNSIFESTREPGIDRIYLCMGQLIAPGAFKIRRYEDCLSDIKITHSPRYTIDMSLGSGGTIFDKLQTSYDSLRDSPHPLKEFKKHYREHVLKDGEAVWWLDADHIDEDSSELDFTKLTHFNALTTSKQSLLISKMFFLFPEVLTGKNSSKYYRCVEWLLSQGVLNHAMRDTFSAGGQVNCKLNGRMYRLPQVLGLLYMKRTEIMGLFSDAIPHEDAIREYWDYAHGSIFKSSLLLFWKRKVVEILSDNDSVKKSGVPISDLINEWFKT